eukprot:409831_1
MNTTWDWNWDNRHKYFVNNIKSNLDVLNGQRTLILIRHGQYNNTVDNENEKILTELGREQSLITGQRLNAMDIKFDKIYCSKLLRAQETAEIIVNQLSHNNINEIVYDKDLNEGLASDIEPFTSYFTIYNKPEFSKLIDNTSKRIKQCFKKYFHRREQYKNENREKILLIGHENVLRYFLVRVLQFNDLGWCRLQLLNCSISTINIMDNGTVKVSNIGDIGHLSVNLLTNNLIKAKL